jgi:hypothetical protein
MIIAKTNILGKKPATVVAGCLKVATGSIQDIESHGWIVSGAGEKKTDSINHVAEYCSE